MKKLLTIIGLIILIANPGFAANPEWVDFDMRLKLYPAQRFFIGFSLEEVGKSEDLGNVYDRLKKNAISELTNSIQVTVESVSTLNTLEFDETFHQEFREKLASFSKIDLTGIQTKTHYNKRGKMAYVVAYVSKDDLIKYYNKIVIDKARAIEQNISLAKQFQKSGDNTSALKSYYECMPLFTEADGAQTIIILLEASQHNLEKINDYEIEVNKAICELHKSDKLSLDEVCGFMAFGFQQQTNHFDPLIRLANFTFEDTKMGSEFSRRFIREFENELISNAGYTITTEARMPAQSSGDPQFIIKGTYWDDGDNIKIIAILRDTKADKPIASVDGYLPKAWLEQHEISWKPENFADVQENLMKFKKNEIVNGNLNLEVWTTKGDESPIFEGGDTLGFYIRVSHPCYIRIIDHFADGSRVLLTDNYYIGTDKINQVVTLPWKFECASPFGAEILQVNAQTEKFPALITEKLYGYDFIRNNLNEIISNTRGFKPIKNEDLKAEKRIVVTTMEKF
nr:hypothetical protein [Bacteroidota bacterium]